MLVGLRNVDRDPADAPNPEPRPAMVMRNRAGLLPGSDRKTELVIGRNSLRSAQGNERRMVIGAVTPFAIAGPQHVAPPRPLRLPIVVHRIDQIIVEPSAHAQRIILWQIEARSDLRYLAADGNQAVRTQIDIEGVWFPSVTVGPERLGLWNHNFGADDIKHQLGSRWARFIERPEEPLVEDSVLVLRFCPNLPSARPNDVYAVDLLTLRIRGNRNPQIDMRGGLREVRHLSRVSELVAHLSRAFAARASINDHDRNHESCRGQISPKHGRASASKVDRSHRPPTRVACQRDETRWSRLGALCLERLHFREHEKHFTSNLLASLVVLGRLLRRASAPRVN